MRVASELARWRQQLFQLILLDTQGLICIATCLFPTLCVDIKGSLQVRIVDRLPYAL
jgi:hypothetical protein